MPNFIYIYSNFYLGKYLEKSMSQAFFCREKCLPPKFFFNSLLNLKKIFLKKMGYVRPCKGYYGLSYREGQRSFRA